MPAAGSSSVQGQGGKDASPPVVPPSTPIPMLQKIGVKVCGIAPEDLSVDKLQQEKDPNEDILEDGTDSEI